MRTRRTVDHIAAAAQSELDKAIHCLELAADYCELVRRTCSENGWPAPQLPNVPDLAPLTLSDPTPTAINPLGQSTAVPAAADSRTAK